MMTRTTKCAALSAGAFFLVVLFGGIIGSAGGVEWGKGECGFLVFMTLMFACFAAFGAAMAANDFLPKD
jgi:hypothetical protein